MELWLLITVTVFTAVLITVYISSLSKSKSKSKRKQPPGPTYFPLITPILWLRKSSLEAESTIRRLRKKFGPIVTLSSSPIRPVIFIFDHGLAHQALIQNGAIFADRPKPLPIPKIVSSNQHTIVFAGYGTVWRLLRRNLTSTMLHSSRINDFSFARNWVLEILVHGIKASSVESKDGVVKVMDHFRFAMFCLLVVMCFGDKLDETQIKEIEKVQQGLLLSLLSRFRVLNLKPWLTRILLKSRWDEFYDLKKKQEDVLLTHIRARKELQKDDRTSLLTCYVDTLLALEIPADGKNRKLSEGELVSACSEFLNAGTDTTATALQWIMANLVKNQNIQTKLLEEIKGVIGAQAKDVGEEELSNMPYLKAVVLEGLRRHPPGHFVLPHAVTKEVELGGYIVPQNAVVNFGVAEMGWDPEVWVDPMEFKPERFISNHDDFDITGSREIKMMPFGAGRRICPGLGLALLHLEYFVANLVWKFEWGVVGEVDLSEKQEFTIVMKHPLEARISDRKILVLLKRGWDEFYDLKKKQEDVLLTHIRAREELQNDERTSLITCYVDTLLGLEIHEDGINRKLSEGELVTTCSELLNASTHTTATTLQWIMANIVKNPNIQTKLFEEIKGVIGGQAEEVREEELWRMPYLKAVVLEGLRRHPPLHFGFPHAVTKEVELGGYILPKNAVVEFGVAEMGLDPKVWDDPMKFKPERFVGSSQDEFDVTGSREIKMMPFGAGMRICPGLGLALLHLEYFVANLVWKFEWSAVGEVDLSEKQEFTIVMKYPLQARISERKTL